MSAERKRLRRIEHGVAVLLDQFQRDEYEEHPPCGFVWPTEYVDELAARDRKKRKKAKK